MKILIVDDSLIDLKVATALSEQLGLEVTAVDNAKKACEHLMSGQIPEILLIDWMMPETNGLELCRIIRNTTFAISPFLIVMSSTNEDEAEETALLKGADEFIRKPLSLRSLGAKIRSAERIIRYQLELIEANQKLANLSMIDDLTGVMNRRAGLMSLHESVARLQRNSGSAAGLVMCDIENFSHIQEENGHAFGDKIIQTFSKRLTNLLRPTDWIARFGGEEFMIFIEGPISELPSILSRLIQASSTQTIDAHSHPVNLSLNISCLALQSHNVYISIDDLLEKADHLLLKAKQESACHFIIEELEPNKYGNVIDFNKKRQRS